MLLSAAGFPATSVRTLESDEENPYEHRYLQPTTLDGLEIRRYSWYLSSEAEPGGASKQDPGLWLWGLGNKMNGFGYYVGYYDVLQLRLRPETTACPSLRLGAKRRVWRFERSDLAHRCNHQSLNRKHTLTTHLEEKRSRQGGLQHADTQTFTHTHTHMPRPS